MRRYLPFAVVLLGLPSMASAESPRSATPAEFGKLLLGCWVDHETTKIDGAIASNTYSEACFHKGGRVDVSWVGVESRDGFDGIARYRFANNKLVLTGPAGWIEANRMVCDAVVVPGRQLKLTNCVDDDQTGTGDQYVFAALPGHTELGQ